MAGLFGPRQYRAVKEMGVVSLVLILVFPPQVVDGLTGMGSQP
jgi:hypothetical protein